ncbi:MAG: phosphoglycerate kinase [Candidatus Diapherotrites archaeon]|nr:phosphoglycerate kinase [Candidatus Diapherotrites archaeon]
METIQYMDGIDFKGKIVLVRIDLNLPYLRETDEFGHSKRLVEHAKTIRELSDKGAKVVVLAHQGRPGKTDFQRLESHADALEQYVGKPVRYCDEIISKQAVRSISELKDSEILLLENIRFLAEEEKENGAAKHAESILVRTLAPLADIFVNDAYSVAHRPHASIIGFSHILPTVAGRVMEEEIKANAHAIRQAEPPRLFIVGGAKPDDCIKAVSNLLEKGRVDLVLTGGVIGNLFLAAAGYNVGKETMLRIEEEGSADHFSTVKQLYADYEDKIELPVDLAFERGGKRVEIDVEDLPADGIVYDIGTKTAEHYAKLIKGAKTINIKGPPGYFENKLFRRGTEIVFKAIADSSAFSLIGGGHTLAAIQMFSLPEDRFGHITMGGGALLAHLCGATLPGVECLKNPILVK